jgi:hypothetical protein
LIDVVRVSVVEVAPPDGVTVAGEKLHVVPAGSPLQTNETGESKPLVGVTAIVALPLCPAINDKEGCETATEKSELGGVVAIEMV